MAKPKPLCLSNSRITSVCYSLHKMRTERRWILKLFGGHTDYQTTANIYTHVRDEMLKKATVNMNEVFQKRTEE